MLRTDARAMTQKPTGYADRLVFRDALESDVPRCLALDASYQTDYVWQMTVQDSGDEVQVNCRRQRLPRTLEARHDVDERQLLGALWHESCFVVIEDPAIDKLLGFVTMRVDANGRVAYLQDLVIDSLHRRRSLGARLAHVARRWAAEYRLRQIIFEIPTTNYPAIRFAQSQGFAFCGFNDHHFANREIALFFSLTV